MKTWEETVLKPTDMLNVIYGIPAREPGEDYSRLSEAMCKKQAQATWEAAIKEVVEWMKQRLILGTVGMATPELQQIPESALNDDGVKREWSFSIDPHEWQAKLKELGFKEG